MFPIDSLDTGTPAGRGLAGLPAKALKASGPAAFAYHIRPPRDQGLQSEADCRGVI